MSREIRAGVRLNLNDQFSSKIQGAGVSLQGFGEKAAGVAGKVNQAFSGLAGTLGAIGVGIGTAALVRGGIEFQNTVTRIATDAGVFGKEVNELGRYFLRVAYDAKVSEKEILAFAAAAAESAVGIKDIKENMPFMADVIQGLGLSGEEAGKIFSVLVRRGADVERLQEIFNNLAESSARLGNVNLPMFTRYLPALLEASGGNLDDVEDIFTAVNMLAEGTVNARQAMMMYQAAMKDFGRQDVQEAIRRDVEVEIVSRETGELKSFAEIMGLLQEFDERHGGEANDYFERAFGISNLTMKAWRLFGNHFEQTVENLGELGDTSNAIARRAEQNASTIQGSLNRLRTAASEFASSTLIQPIERLADLLNNHPDGMRNAVIGLSTAIAALAGMKAFSTVVTFIGSLKKLKSGGGGIAGGLGGGAGIPVHVTNMGAGIGPAHALQPMGKTLTPTTRMLVAGAGITAVVAAAQSIPQMTAELREIDQDETLTNRERGEARGGAIGDATGTITASAVGGAIGIKAGAATGAKVGAALGTVVPGIGNIVGLVIGAGIGAAMGHFGGRAGRELGRRIGGAAAGDDYYAGGYPFVMQTPSYLLDEVRAAQGIPYAAPLLSVGGEIILRSELIIDDKNYHLRQSVIKNDTPYRFAVGNAAEARLIQ